MRRHLFSNSREGRGQVLKNCVKRTTPLTCPAASGALLVLPSLLLLSRFCRRRRTYISPTISTATSTATAADTETATVTVLPISSPTLPARAAGPATVGTVEKPSDTVEKAVVVDVVVVVGVAAI